LPGIVPTPGIQFDEERRRPSLPAYLRSLDMTSVERSGSGGRLSALHLCAYPGHGEPIADLQKAASWTVRTIEQRARRLLSRLRSGPGSAYAIARRVYPRLDHRHLRPVMAETLGLLDLLAERGLAYAQESDDRVTWMAT
jgi:hypothetical protein